MKNYRMSKHHGQLKSKIATIRNRHFFKYYVQNTCNRQSQSIALTIKWKSRFYRKCWKFYFLHLWKNLKKFCCWWPSNNYFYSKAIYYQKMTWWIKLWSLLQQFMGPRCTKIRLVLWYNPNEILLLRYTVSVLSNLKQTAHKIISSLNDVIKKIKKRGHRIF